MSKTNYKKFTKNVKTIYTSIIEGEFDENNIL